MPPQKILANVVDDVRARPTCNDKSLRMNRKIHYIMFNVYLPTNLTLVGVHASNHLRAHPDSVQATYAPVVTKIIVTAFMPIDPTLG